MSAQPLPEPKLPEVPGEAAGLEPCQGPTRRPGGSEALQGGETAGVAEVVEEQAEEAEEATVRQARAPWHFKVILVGSVVYLGWRAYQGISWLAHHIH